ncbi:MAG: rhodanese-like domain-containing protein [Acidobacteria bacterium]|nr:rhodanese-like domain-containing protein [Acidobacteriota bacterium]
MEAVESHELLRRVREGEVTVLDVRPSEEYRAGHIPGALSVPLPELKKRLAELPKTREIVAAKRVPHIVLPLQICVPAHCRILGGPRAARSR